MKYKIIHAEKKAILQKVPRFLNERKFSEETQYGCLKDRHLSHMKHFSTKKIVIAKLNK